MAIHITIYGGSGLHPRRPTMIIEGRRERQRREEREQLDRIREAESRGAIMGISLASDRIGP